MGRWGGSSASDEAIKKKKGRAAPKTFCTPKTGEVATEVGTVAEAAWPALLLLDADECHPRWH